MRPARPPQRRGALVLGLWAIWLGGCASLAHSIPPASAGREDHALAAFDVRLNAIGRRPTLLSPASIELMVAAPPGSPRGGPTFYAMGWDVRPVGQDANWWHAGSLPGSTALLVRTHDRRAWVALFNARPRDWRVFLGEVDRALWQAAGEIRRWPPEDFFRSPD